MASEGQFGLQALCLGCEAGIRTLLLPQPWKKPGAVANLTLPGSRGGSERVGGRAGGEAEPPPPNYALR